MSAPSPTSLSGSRLPAVATLTTPIPVVRDILLDSPAAGQYLGVSHTTINKMFKDGRLRGEVTGTGTTHLYRRVRLSEVERFRQDWVRAGGGVRPPYQPRRGKTSRVGGLSPKQLAQRRSAIQRAVEVRQQRRAKVERVLESILDRLHELEHPQGEKA